MMSTWFAVANGRGQVLFALGLLSIAWVAIWLISEDDVLISIQGITLSWNKQKG